MNIGEKLLNLRKSKHLSQEEVAEKLNVSRQTISKWETDQSMPDFDKIVPLCELYQISADELLMNKKSEKEVVTVEPRDSGDDVNRRKRAMGVSFAVFGYFLAVVWIVISIPAFKFDPLLSSAIFLLICGFSTLLLVYTCIAYKRKKEKAVDKRSKLEKQIDSILALITLIIYLFLSFGTMAWHITWILWVVYGLIQEIVKLLFLLRGMDHEE